MAAAVAFAVVAATVVPEAAWGSVTFRVDDLSEVAGNAVAVTVAWAAAATLKAAGRFPGALGPVNPFPAAPPELVAGVAAS